MGYSKFILISMFLAITACVNMPQPPKDVELCSVDLPAGVCHRFLKDSANTWQYVGDKSLTAIDKNWVITPEHLIEIKNYANDLGKWISANVK